MKKDGQVSRTWLISKIVKNLSALNMKKKTEENSLTGDIKQAMDELDNIRKFYNLAEEPEHIEYAIFAEKAAVTRLSYLIKQAKINEDTLNIPIRYLK